MSGYRLFKTFIPFGIVIMLAVGCRLPEILLPTGDITIDAGDSISFSARSYPDAIYRWTFDGGANDLNEQNPTVRFDRVGVYNVVLTVLFNDLELGVASLKVTVNDPSPLPYTLSLDGYTATRDIVDSKTLAWVLEKDGDVVLRRNAKDESDFIYFDNSKGHYKIWLERFSDGHYIVASNKVEYIVP